MEPTVSREQDRNSQIQRVLESAESISNSHLQAQCNFLSVWNRAKPTIEAAYSLAIAIPDSQTPQWLVNSLRLMANQSRLASSSYDAEALARAEEAARAILIEGMAYLPATARN